MVVGGGNFFLLGNFSGDKLGFVAKFLAKGGCVGFLGERERES